MCIRIGVPRSREGGRKVMDALLIALLLAIVLSVGGTIIILRLFAHGSGQVSRPRSARRVYVIPRSYTIDTTISIEDHEAARYAHRAIATLAILLGILSALIYSVFNTLVVH